MLLFLHVNFLKTALYQGFFRPFIIDKTLFLLYVLLVFKGLRYGFASKSMVESKNLKLKLGLCGLALTSFLALNSRAVVHADTVNGGNANAITWDSDQDDSQVVHEDSNQSQPTQNAQGQAPATQSVQSNVQKRAEMSAVRVSNFDTSAVNRNNAQNVRAQANQVKVSNVNATEAVRVTNPQNSQIVVHYVKTNGQSAGLHDQTISMSKSGNGSYSAPSGYTLAQGNGSYNVNVTSKETIPDFDVYWNTETNRLHLHKNQSYKTETGSFMDLGFNIKWDSNGKYVGATDGELITDNDAKRLALNLVRNAAKATNQGDLLTGYTTDWSSDRMHPMNYFRIDFWPLSTDPYPPAYGGKPVDRFRIEYGSDNWDASPYAFVQDNRYRTLDDTDSDDDWNKNDFQMAEKLKSWWLNKRTQLGLVNPDKDAYYTAYAHDDNGGMAYPIYSMFVASSNGKQFANGDTIFTDGGSATSVVGNHINVPVTQPQSVDPNSSDCRRQATRVIHIAFPNGVKPESYDSITDSAGNKLTLDSNNNLTQTVTFTRSKTVDSLTGATLSQTNWQQHGAINAVTLPDIPGYTMTQTK